MVSKYPPPDMMSPEDRTRLEEKLAQMPDEVEEVAISSNGVARSLDDLLPESDGFRYRKKQIFGIAKPVRFRSLTARHFEQIAAEEDRNILLYSVCDEEGRLFLTSEDLQRLIDKYDARTYAQLLHEANLHCLGRGGLSDLVEEEAGN